MIRAEVHDDAFRTSSRFDATEWFQQASDQEILDLAKIDWRGDYPADVVAEFFDGMDVGVPSTVDDVFKAVNILDIGFEVSIEPEDALRWVKLHRPHLMDKINDI